MDIKFNFQDTLQRLDKISSCIYVPGNKTIFPDFNMYLMSKLVHVTGTVVCVRYDIDDSADEELKKLYQYAVISETSYILGHETQARDIFVKDKMIFVIFETPLKQNFKGIMNASAKVNAIKDVINMKLGNGKNHLSMLISMSFGNLMMQMIPCPVQDVKTYNIIWTGDAVDNATYLSKNIKDMSGILIEPIIYDNLDDEDKSFFEKTGSYYKAHFKNVLINNWLKQNQQYE